MLIIYLTVLVVSLYFVSRILGPEMKNTASPKGASGLSSSSQGDSFRLQDNSPAKRIEKLEVLLAEKNKNINLLQNELMVYHAQARDFDKIKSLQEEEIQRLREQNRVFRSELGMPAVQLNKN